MSIGPRRDLALVDSNERIAFPPTLTGKLPATAAGGPAGRGEEEPVSSKPWGTEKLQKYLCYVKDTFTSVRLSKDAEVRGFYNNDQAYFGKKRDEPWKRGGGVLAVVQTV